MNNQYKGRVKINDKVSKNASEDEIKHILNATYIEDLFIEGKKNQERRFYLHDLNDEKFNLNYAYG